MFTTNSKINSVAFTPEEVKQNLHMGLIVYLLSFNQKSENSFFDIHITTDGLCTIVEFANITRGINDTLEGFVYMDEDHYLLKRVEFPDGHYDYLDDNEAEDVFNDWLKEHPGWEKDKFGRWYLACHGDTDGDEK